MTESQWRTSADPGEMLRHLEKACRISDRKYRLFAVACCREVWDDLSETSHRCVDAAERCADDASVRKEMLTAYGDAWSTERLATGDANEAARWCCYPHEGHVRIAADMAYVQTCRRGKNYHPDMVERAWILRDLVGNPFRPVRVDPAWLAWNDGIIPSMARRIYASQDYSAMPILADALTDAGCDNLDLLRHCQSLELCRRCDGVGGWSEDSGGTTPWDESVEVWQECTECHGRGFTATLRHHRGCWLIDALLGKE